MVERAALDVIAQATRRANDDVGAAFQRATLGAGVHAADAGDDGGACVRIEPSEFALHLEREFASWRDDEGERSFLGHRVRAAQERIGKGETVGNGLAGARLSRDDEVAVGGIGLRSRRPEQGSAHHSHAWRAHARAEGGRKQRSSFRGFFVRAALLGSRHWRRAVASSLRRATYRRFRGVFGKRLLYAAETWLYAAGRAHMPTREHKHSGQRPRRRVGPRIGIGGIIPVRPGPCRGSGAPHGRVVDRNRAPGLIA